MFVFWVLFIYPWHKSFIRYMFLKIFSPSGGLPFHSLSLEDKKFLILMTSNLSIFTLYIMLLVVRILCATQATKVYITFFFWVYTTFTHYCSVSKSCPTLCDPMDYSMPSFPAFSISWSFSSVQLLSSVRLFATLWSAERQTSLSITNSQSLLKLIVIGLAMLSDHLILCRPLLLLPSIFPNFRGFSNESVLRIKWPKYCSFSFSISPSNEYSELISFRMDWLDLLQSKGLSRVFSNTTIQKQTSNLIRMVLVLWQDRLSALYLPCLSHWI